MERYKTKFDILENNQINSNSYDFLIYDYSVIKEKTSEKDMKTMEDNIKNNVIKEKKVKISNNSHQYHIKNNWNQRKSKKNFNKQSHILLIIDLLLVLISIVYTEDTFDDINKYPYITCKITEGYNKFINNGEGDNLNSHFRYTRPDEILINGVIYDFSNATNYIFNFTEPINNVHLIWKNNMTYCCYNMFRGCEKMIEIDLSHFFPAGITDLANFFWDCFSLSKIDFTNFDTTQITSCGNMFHNCISLTSLNLTFFQLPTLYIDSMFYNCHSLKILDFPNFNIIPSMRKISNIFQNCTSLEYLNIGNFEPNNNEYTDFYEQFLGDTKKNLVICSDNTDIISNIPNSKCYTISCGDNWQIDKKRINTENDDCMDSCESANYKYEYNFECIPNCFSGTYNDNTTCRDCHPDCKECNGPNNSDCILCADDRFNYLGICVSNCPRGYYNDKILNQKNCKCELPNCFSCNIESLNKGLCIEYEEGYYPIYNINNDYLFKNCSKSVLGYYLDKDDLIYKKCYKTCEKCEIGGDDSFHNCIECKPEYNNVINFGLYKNCYNICKYYHYLDKTNNIKYCTSSQKCPEDYEKIILEKNECISSCANDNKYKYEFKKRCYEMCPLVVSMNRVKNVIANGISYNKDFCKPICTKGIPFELIRTQECLQKCPIDEMCIDTEKEPKDYDAIMQNIESYFLSNNYNTSDLENGNNEVYEIGDMKITLTTTKNQKNDKRNANMTTIDLGKCEEVLRQEYNITNEDFLFMKIIEVSDENMKIPKIEYDVYSNFNGNNLVELNLKSCEDTTIDIFIPVQLTEDKDKLNSSSDYYSEICYSATSDYGTDLTLEDRKNEFIDNNMTVCQENCIFSDYDYDIQKAKCSCEVEESSQKKTFADMNINVTALLKNFIDIKKNSNIQILNCYQELFTGQGFIKNIGSYILIVIILTHFIIIILFYIKKLYNDIIENIKDITNALMDLKLKRRRSIKNKKTNVIQKEKKENKENKTKVDALKIKAENKSNKPEKPKTDIFNENNNGINIFSRKLNSYIKYQLTFPNSPTKKRANETNIDLPYNNEITIQKRIKRRNVSNNNKTNIVNNSSAIEIELSDKVKEILKNTDEEINQLPYKFALKYDTRKYYQYYFSLIRTKHPLIFTFFNNNDYNIKIIKIDLFLFSFSLYFTVNALFFNDDTMHKIYEDKGVFNFLFQLPSILYSVLISATLNSLLKLLAFSGGSILEYKSNKFVKFQIDLDEREKKLVKMIKIKFIIYFIISTIISLFCWYYLSMFCAIYRNTQIYLIKDTLISYSLSLCYPLLINLLPVFFRIPALFQKSKERRLLYRISKLLQML